MWRPTRRRFLVFFIVTLSLVAAPLRARAEVPAKHLSIMFNGAAGKVGGSCFLLDADGEKVLLDCGLAFDAESDAGGASDSEPLFAFEPKTITAVVLSHIHLDHAGALPLLVKQGFHGRIHATRVTRELAAIALQGCYRYGDFGMETFYVSTRSQGKKTATVHVRPDCESGSKIRQRKEFQGHRTALEANGQHVCRRCMELELDEVMRLFDEHPYHVPFVVGSRFTATLQPTGHIPGSAMTTIVLQRSNGTFRVIWSGDYGGGTHPFLPQPETVKEGQVMLVESTYGGNTDPEKDPVPELLSVVSGALAQGRRVLVPAFTLDRSQRVLAALAQGRRVGTVPDVPVYLTSRTIEEYTLAYQRFSRDRATYGESFNVGFFSDPFRGLTWKMFHGKTAPSGPSVVVASSADGKYGACAELLPAYVADPKAVVVKVGWSDPSSPMGRLWAAQQRGASTVELSPSHTVALRASLSSVSLSAHGHASSVAKVALGCRGLRTLFLVHGEPDGLASFAAYLGTLLPREVQIRVPHKAEQVQLF